MREVSIEEPSGEGKGERSRRFMRVFLKEGRVARARAVESPKTPEPIIRIEDGGEDEGAIGMLEKYRKNRGGVVGSERKQLRL